MPLIIHSHNISARSSSLRRECESRARVLVVDDDEDRWASLRRDVQVLDALLDVSPAFPDQLAFKRPETPICLVLALSHGRCGLKLLRQLNAAENPIPIIFVAESADVATSVEAMKGGAFDFFCQPYQDLDLLEAIDTALDRDRSWCKTQQHFKYLTRQYETLSTRERQVMEQIVKGKMNKQVAFTLGISEITVKAHRGRVMRKLNVTSLPELTRIADTIARRTTNIDDGSAGPTMKFAGQVAR